MMSTATEKRAVRTAAEDDLREILSTHETVFAIVTHVSRSGMQRRIQFYVIDGGDMRRLSHLVATVLGERLTDDGVVINGTGMDMGWHEIYSCRYQLGLGETRYSGSSVGDKFQLGYGFTLRYL
jgi:hypothetical protein